MAYIYLVKRVACGLDEDKFVFGYKGKKYERKYGSRLDDRQALNEFKKELSKRFSVSQT